VQPRHYGALWTSQRFGYLGVAKFLKVAKHEYFAVLRRQPVHRSPQPIAHLVAGSYFGRTHMRIPQRVATARLDKFNRNFPAT